MAVGLYQNRTRGDANDIYCTANGTKREAILSDSRRATLIQRSGRSVIDPSPTKTANMTLLAESGITLGGQG